MKIRKPYIDRKAVKFTGEVLDRKTGEYVKDVVRTKQADKDGCDINNILSRYEKTGMLPSMISRDPRYGDFSDVKSYEESLNIVAHANEQFMALDASVRAKFDNDPAKMLEFVSDEKNYDELVKLGLAVKKDKKEVQTPDAPATSPSANGGAKPSGNEGK